MTDRKPPSDYMNVHRYTSSPPAGEFAVSPPPSRDRPARSTSNAGSGASSHRTSFTDNLRTYPPSPRERRQPSLSHIAVQELVNNPPAAKPVDPAFAGRDWREVQVGELVSDADVHFVELDTGVEAATNELIESGIPVVLIRESKGTHKAVGTFDYSDLNAYLLLAVGLAKPDGETQSLYTGLAKRAHDGEKIPVKDIQHLGSKEPLVTMSHKERLTKAVEVFGSGIHRIIIVRDGSQDVLGILSQTRLVRFFWENGRNFPAIDYLYPHVLRDLQIGSSNVIAINGDKPLTEALGLMDSEGITSLAVIDNHSNVIGNISTADVKHLTRSSSLPLLQSSCVHFISVTLSTRGMNDGKDSFPVFYVNPLSTLAHSMAKLVATKAHRLWIVDSPSPASSAPSTPGAQHAVLAPPAGVTSASSIPASGPPFSVAPSPSVSASSLPGTGISGHLMGVISLTDILNLFARSSGLSPTNPNEARNQRRRSSSSSLRPSIDTSRSPSVDLRR